MGLKENFVEEQLKYQIFVKSTVKWVAEDYQDKGIIDFMELKGSR